MIGCLDGSYISVVTPANKIRSTYTNRHDQTSITLQAICDAEKRFLDVVAGAPSKMHDSRIFKKSPISRTLPTICEGRFHILADGAYEIREHLLTPYRNYENLTAIKKRYNDKFCSTRVVIENAFGILKKRFRQLMKIEIRDVDRITKFIITCCVLHNICIDDGDDYIDETDHLVSDNDLPVAEPDVNHTYEGRATHLRRLGELKREAISNILN